MKKRILALLMTTVLLVGIFAAFSASAQTEDPFSVYTDGKISFASYNEGADAAFDGNNETGFAGTVIGTFNGKHVLSGITVYAVDELTDVVVGGSEDGKEWIQLYNTASVVADTPVKFGSQGGNPTSGAIRDQMYTYVFEYVKIETASGEIAELSLYGYKVDVTGKMINLDTSWETSGYKVSLSNYNPPRTSYVFDHIIGADYNKGDVCKPATGDETKNAWFAVKFDAPKVITEMSFAHRSGENKVDALKRFNGIYFEASVDGNTWTKLAETGDDFYQNHDLNKFTICVLDVNNNTEYNYARIRTDKNSQGAGWLQLAEFNVFGITKEEALAPKEQIFQLTTGTNAQSTSTDMRVITAIADVKSYTAAGYLVSLSNSNPEMDGTGVTNCSLNKVYGSILANGETINASKLGGSSLAVIEIRNIQNANFGTNIYIRPYVTLTDGTTVLGDTVCVSVISLLEA